jgi:3,4-dihydroxy 2-butanone 4-phosphate synthase/GTP cyclohydrolase II
MLIDDLSSSRAALIAPAENISTELVNRLATLSGGLTFVAVSPERANALMLSPMVRQGAGDQRLPSPTTLQYVSVEAREGITTGISASDRARTLQILGSSSIQPRMLVKPGHIFPVQTREGGVLVRTAIPEGALDLVRMSGHTDAAVFVDLLSDQGENLTLEQAKDRGRKEAIPTILLSELIQHRLQKEPLVRRVAEAVLPTTLAGEVRAIVYRSTISDVEHIALVKGELDGDSTILVRVQAEQTIGDVFGGTSQPSRSHLLNSLKAVGERGCGIILYLRRPFMSDGGSAVQPITEPPLRSVTKMREYGIGAQILRELGVKKVELLTSTTRSLEGLPSFGITVVAQIPIPDLITSKEHFV